MKQAATQLQRTTFETSRLLEYFSEKELSMQLGHGRDLWRLVLAKELIDNGLDACESAGILPEIRLYLSDNGYAVRDNGPGLPESTIQRSLDYLVRVSDKANYVSPSRGQLGNALKCVWAAPFVADGEHGKVEVSTAGKTHTIAVTLDRIAQEPTLSHTVRVGGLKNGTLVRIPCPKLVKLASSDDLRKPRDFYKELVELLSSYAIFNPHATFILKTRRGAKIWPRSSETWQHWLPSEPTSPHWYSVEKFVNLITAYLSKDRKDGRGKTVRELVAEFRGLAGSAKQKEIGQESGLGGSYLKSLVVNGAVDSSRASILLSAMKSRSAPVKPDMLGAIGEQSLSSCLESHCGADLSFFRFKKVKDTTGDGLPFVVEAAFAVKRDQSEDRTTALGVNWSPIVDAAVGHLAAMLGRQRVDTFDPVVAAVHVACPSLEFTDRGKRSLALPDEIEKALWSCVEFVAREWEKAKNRADRNRRVRERDLEQMRRQDKPMSIKDAALQVMERAYVHASGDGSYPAHARQVMYAARPLVLELTAGKCWTKAAYFTQELLPEFMEEFPKLTESWDVTYDARGHLMEPHTDHQIGIGTLEVRQYIESWRSAVSENIEGAEFDHTVKTMGPHNRFKFALFVEKEGFYDLFRQARIAERFDIVSMSTKGMSVTAMRRLVDELSGAGVTVLLLHDFDKSGFSIASTIQTDSRRYTFKNKPKVIDLGLRLADVQEMRLQSEPVSYSSNVDPRENLRENGATKKECDFLVQNHYGGWTGKRVELNAMTSPQLIEFLEKKLIAAGVKKVVPDDEALASAYRRAVKLQKLEEAIADAREEIDAMEISVPKRLAAKIIKAIKGKGTPWDVAVWDMAAKNLEDE